MPRRSGAACAPVSRWRRRAPCIPRSSPCPRTSGRCAPARRHRRLVPALHAARRHRSARRHPARYRRLRASVRRRGEAARRSPGAHDGLRLFGTRRHCRDHRHGLGRGALRRWTAITAAGDERDALAPLPLAALRLPGETVAALARVGLKRIGDILDLPRAPLAARFGAISCASSTARSAARTSRSPRACRLRLISPSSSFHEPIAREEDVLATVERLAARLKTALAARGDGARRLELACSAPTARSSASRPAPRVRCAIRRRSARCSSNGSPRSATRSIRASASIWRGFRCSTPSRVRTSRSVSADARIRPSSTAWSTA